MDTNDVTVMVDMPQLEVKEEYWLSSWVFVAPMGSWSCLLMRDATQVWHAMLGAIGARGTSCQPKTRDSPKHFLPRDPVHSPTAVAVDPWVDIALLRTALQNCPPILYARAGCELSWLLQDGTNKIESQQSSDSPVLKTENQIPFKHRLAQSHGQHRSLTVLISARTASDRN